MSDYRHGSHTTFAIHLPIMWITKYRHKVLRGEVAERVRAIVCVFHGFLPPSPRECCHPRSVATLDRMISLCALLLSMDVASAAHFFAALLRGQQMHSQSMRQAPRPLGSAASRWSLRSNATLGGLPYTDGTCLGTVACRLRMESPFKAILYALWTSRSRMASARVGSPIASCQCSTGS